jgi:hypothetical protein
VAEEDRPAAGPDLNLPPARAAAEGAGINVLIPEYPPFRVPLFRVSPFPSPYPLFRVG